MTCIPTSNSYTFTGDGVTTNISFTFQYQNIEDIKVRTGEFPDFVEVPTTEYYIDPANPTVVVFNPAPTLGVNYTIYRCTDDNSLVATFQAGSAIRAVDLNDNFEQMLFITQDASNRAINLEGNVEISLEDAEEALDKANEAIDRVDAVEDRIDQVETSVNEALDQISEVVDYKVVPNVPSINTVFPDPKELDGCQITDSTGLESYTPLTNLPAGFVGDPGLGARILYRGTSWEFVNVLLNDPDGRFINADGDNVTGDYTIGGSLYSDEITSPSFGGDGFTLGRLNDVNLTGLLDGQTLVYNAASDQWVPGVGSGGGSGGIDSPPTSIPGSTITLNAASFSTDTNKIEFSTDGGQTWVTSITTQIGDIVECRWTEDAFDAVPHNTTDTTTMTYTKITRISGRQQTYASVQQAYSYDVDKVPVAFNFADKADTNLATPEVSPTTVTLSSINARTRAWATSVNASSPQLEIDGVWVDVPSTPDDSVLIPNNTDIKLRHTTDDVTLQVGTTTLYIGWDQNTGNFESDTYTTSNVNAGVAKPSITNIPNDLTDVPLNLTIVSSQFVGIGPVTTHDSTDWQLATDSNFNNIVSESLNDTTNLTSWTPIFADDTEFFLRVRYNGSEPSVSSPWSDVIRFVTVASFIYEPVFTSPASSDPSNMNSLTVTTSEPTGVAFGSHTSTSWQYANDSSFTDIIAETTEDTGSKTSWTATANFPSTAVDGTRYVRAKFFGSTGTSSEWSAPYEVNAVKFYKWQLQIDSRAKNGSNGFCNNNASSPRGYGAQGVVTLETSVETYLPPDEIQTWNSYGAGGGANSDINRNGKGGASTAAAINGTVVIVSGGGGGGGPTTNCSGKDGATLTIGGNSNATAGQRATATASDWPNRPTGGGGGGGGGGTTTNCGGNGGGGFGLAVNTTIGNWKITNNFTRSKANHVDPRGRNVLTLKNQFASSGSWGNEVTYESNINGPIANILPGRSLNLIPDNWTQEQRLAAMEELIEEYRSTYDQ